MTIVALYATNQEIEDGRETSFNSFQIIIYFIFLPITVVKDSQVVNSIEDKN